VSEHECLENAKLGNHNAFNQLIKPYISSAHQTAYMLLHDRGWAEDAVQEALLQTYQSLHRFDPGKASFKTWFHRIVIHTTWKLARKKRLILPWRDIMDRRKQNQPEEVYLQEESERMLYESVKRLALKYQTVIVLYYMHELSVSDIAIILDVKEGTVKSRLYHARAKLKQHWCSIDIDLTTKEGWSWNKN